MADHRVQIGDQTAGAIVLHPIGFIGLVIATLIVGDGLIVAAELDELRAPSVPELREAMDEDNERSLTRRCVVKAHPVAVQGPVLDCPIVH